MTAAIVLCVTPLDSHPLLPGGARLYERQAQLRTVVRRRLSERHADLLAEPQPHQADSVVWLTSVSGIVRPLGTLPRAVRDSVRSECDALLADIVRVGQELAGAGAGDARLAGDLLRGAARRVGDDYLFLVGNQPVLAHWGAAPREAAAQLGVSATSEADRPIVPTPPTARWLIGALSVA